MSENKAVARRREIHGVLTKLVPQLGSLLPKHLTPERAVRVAFTALQRQPKLFECTDQSIALAVLQASELGLELNLLGEAYMVPYGNTAQFIPGYQGLIKLARRSPEVANIVAEVVYKGDEFDYELGLTPSLKHRPKVGASHRDEDVLCFYSIGYFTDPRIHPVIKVMDREEVELVRKRSRAATNGPWVTDWQPMGLKTVAKRTCKWMPRSAELERALEADERAEAGLPPDIVDMGEAEIVEPEEKSKPTAAEKAKSAAAQAKARSGKQTPNEPEPEQADETPSEVTEGPLKAFLEGVAGNLASQVEAKVSPEEEADFVKQVESILAGDDTLTKAGAIRLVMERKG